MQLLVNPNLSHTVPMVSTFCQQKNYSEDQLQKFFGQYFSALSGPVKMRSENLIEQISILTCERKRKVYIWDEMTKISEMQFLQSQVPLKRPLVDVCCGYGYWISKIIDKIDCGVDLFPDHGRFARTITGIAERDFIDNTYQTVLRADITKKLPIPDNSVATVTAVCSLEHIPEYLQAINEIQRILKPGGILLMTVDAPLLVEVLDEIFNEKYCRRFKEEHQLQTLLSLSRWKGILEESGFDIVSSTGYIDRVKTAICLMTYFPGDFSSYWTQLGFSELFVKDSSARSLWNTKILPDLIQETDPEESMLIAIAARKVG